MTTRRTFSILGSLPVLLLGVAASGQSAQPGPNGLAPALAAVSAARIGARIQFLADDALEGRGTGTRGAAIAARWVAAEFAEDGLAPAGDDGTYLQHFQMVGVATDSTTSLSLATPGGPIALRNGDNCVVSTRAQQPRTSFDAPLVFVGYGITSPEMGWDDYKDFDASGKVLVCLVNDPPSDDPRVFGGKALTYYGRWTYKYEEGARRHAQGVLLVHTTKSAGYGWQVVRNSWSGEQAQLPLDPGVQELPLNGWLTQEAATRIFASCGLDLGALAEAAGKPGFAPVPLEGVRLQGDLVARLRRFETENVVGRLEGSDPRKKDTCVVLTAHFDHLGIGRPDKSGDDIYNGAVDNASGVATLLEIARTAADGRWRPARSVLFLAVTAEERGLLGSSYAAQHLPVPIASIAANFNMDGTSVHGETQDFTLLGLDRTTLEPIVRGVPAAMHVKLSPDAYPEQGAYFRSDHFSLARVGVPAVSVKAGWLFRGHDAAYGDSLFHDYNDHHYHQPSDQYDPKWDLSGTVQECRFVMRLTDAVANSPQMPHLLEGEYLGGAVAGRRNSH